MKDLIKMGATLDKARIDTGQPKSNGARMSVIDVPFTGAFAELDIDAPDGADNSDLGE